MLGTSSVKMLGKHGPMLEAVVSLSVVSSDDGAHDE